MGWAKYDEDIREKIDSRMRDSGRSYYGNTYINRYPDYPSKRSVSASTTYYVPQSTYRPTTSTYRPTTPSYRPTTVTIPVTPTRVVAPKAWLHLSAREGVQASLRNSKGMEKTCPNR